MEEHLNKFADWYSTAKRGSEYVYFTGHLAQTRGPILDDTGRMTKAAKMNELNILCDQLWRMAEDGSVSLVQRRLGSPPKTADGKKISPVYCGQFQYIAQKVK